jgi:hypothetical protein
MLELEFLILTRLAVVVNVVVVVAVVVAVDVAVVAVVFTDLDVLKRFDRRRPVSNLDLHICLSHSNT